MIKEKATIDDVLERMQEGFNAVNGRLDGIDGRLDAMEARLVTEIDRVKTLIANLAASFVRKDEVV